MNATEHYFGVLAARIDSVRQRNAEQLQEIAGACSESLRAGGAIHIFDTGHLVSRELINRAGGLAACIALNFSLTVENPHPARDVETDIRGDTPAAPELVRASLAQSRLRSGDVLVVGSVSGVSSIVVELALQASEIGAITVALTSFEYSDALQPRHPSGKRLREVTRFALDNGAPYGDALMQIDGLDHPCCPFSGIGAVACLWGLIAAICERMIAEGAPPTVYPSINLPNGPSLYSEAKKRFLEKGF